MQYEQSQQRVGKTGEAIEKDCVLLAYNLPYRDAKGVPNVEEENSETDPYTQIFVGGKFRDNHADAALRVSPPLMRS